MKTFGNILELIRCLHIYLILNFIICFMLKICLFSSSWVNDYIFNVIYLMGQIHILSDNSIQICIISQDQNKKTIENTSHVHGWLGSILLNVNSSCMHALSLQLCPTLCNPMDCSPPGSSVHGILQVRVLEWAAMPSTRGSSPSRHWT